MRGAFPGRLGLPAGILSPHIADIFSDPLARANPFPLAYLLAAVGPGTHFVQPQCIHRCARGFWTKNLWKNGFPHLGHGKPFNRITVIAKNTIHTTATMIAG